LTRNFENFLFFGNLQNFLAAEIFFLDDKLVWDVHSDEERASSYFGFPGACGLQFTPSNPYSVVVIRAWILIACFVHVCSHVLDAFLWDTDDGDGPEDCSSDALGYGGARSCSFVSGIGDNLNASCFPCL
jgi:hypothetical protein